MGNPEEYEVSYTEEQLDSMEYDVSWTPPEGPVGTKWKTDFLKESAPGNLRGIVDDIHDIMRRNQNEREIHREQGVANRVNPLTMGKPALTEGRVPIAVHLAMEEKYGQQWFQDDELFERFMKENPGYMCYEWGLR